MTTYLRRSPPRFVIPDPAIVIPDPAIVIPDPAIVIPDLIRDPLARVAWIAGRSPQ